MELITFDTQVETLYHHLRNGMVIDRVNAFKLFGVADLRSRISDIERDYGLTIDRRTKPGKRYREYFVSQILLDL